MCCLTMTWMHSGTQRSGKMVQTTVTLNSGHKMPLTGMGVWRADPGVIHNLILEAIKIGYRHFDCAGNTLV